MTRRSTPQTIDEAARRRFEQAWREGRPEPIERFLPAAHDPHYLPTLLELAYIELELAWKAADPVAQGPRPMVEVYLARFPPLRCSEHTRP